MFLQILKIIILFDRNKFKNLGEITLRLWTSASIALVPPFK
jgi:hypothetical protein